MRLPWALQNCCFCVKTIVCSIGSVQPGKQGGSKLKTVICLDLVQVLQVECLWWTKRVGTIQEAGR